MAEDREKNSNNKARLWTVGIGLIFLVIGILDFVIMLKMPHYTATVTSATDVVKTHDDDGDKKFKLKVNVTYTDGNGKEQTAENVRITKGREDEIPRVGDKIEVMKMLFVVKEYSMLRPVAIMLVGIVLGVIFIIFGIKEYGRKSKKSSKP